MLSSVKFYIFSFEFLSIISLYVLLLAVCIYHSLTYQYQVMFPHFMPYFKSTFLEEVDFLFLVLPLPSFWLSLTDFLLPFFEPLLSY